MANSLIDFIIRIKNGYMAQKESVIAQHSVLNESIASKLKVLGFIKDFHIEGDKIRKILVDLSYDNGIPALTGVKIYSRPGRRWYARVKDIKPVLGGVGISILSTPKGVLTGKEAKQQKAGGELLFDIW